MRLLPILVFACCATSAQAETVTGTIPVSLTVLPACSLVTAPLSFTATAGSGADAQSPIQVACNSDTAVEVSLDNGRNGVAGERRLAGAGGTYVSYRIYADESGTREWAGQPVTASIPAGTPLQLVAYGRVEAAATMVPHGEYTDSVTVTLAF